MEVVAPAARQQAAAHASAGARDEVAFRHIIAAHHEDMPVMTYPFDDGPAPTGSSVA